MGGSVPNHSQGFNIAVQTVSVQSQWSVRVGLFDLITYIMVNLKNLIHEFFKVPIKY